MISRENLEAADKAPQNKDTWKNLAAAAKADGMDQRDARDLLMEHGADGVTATNLTRG